MLFQIQSMLQGAGHWTWQQASQEELGYVLDLRIASGKFDCMRFLVPESLGMRKLSPLRSPYVCGNKLNQPTSHPLLSSLYLCPGFLRTMTKRDTDRVKKVTVSTDSRSSVRKCLHEEGRP